MVTDGDGTEWRRNIAENFNRLSRVHERYRRQTTDDRQTTDGPTTTYSEHEHEFTFAENQQANLQHSTDSTEFLEQFSHRPTGHRDNCKLMVAMRVARRACS